MNGHTYICVCVCVERSGVFYVLSHSGGVGRSSGERAHLVPPLDWRRRRHRRVRVVPGTDGAYKNGDMLNARYQNAAGPPI